MAVSAEPVAAPKPIEIPQAQKAVEQLKAVAGTTGEQPQPENAGEDEVRLADTGRLVPEQARDVLIILAGRYVTVAIQRDIAEVQALYKSGTYTDKEAKNHITRLQDRLRFAEKRANEFDKKVSELQKSNSAEDKALGYDIDIHLQEYNLTEAETQIQALKLSLTTATTDVDKTKIQDNITKAEAEKALLEQRINTAKTARNGIENSQNIPDQVVKLTEAMVGQNHLTPETQAQIIKNPVLYISNYIQKAVDNPQVREGLINNLKGAGILDKDGEKGLRDLLEGQKANKLLGLGKKVGIASIILTIMMAWLARKRQSDGNGQQMAA